MWTYAWLFSNAESPLSIVWKALNGHRFVFYCVLTVLQCFSKWAWSIYWTNTKSSHFNKHLTFCCIYLQIVESACPDHMTCGLNYIYVWSFKTLFTASAPQVHVCKPICLFIFKSSYLFVNLVFGLWNRQKQSLLLRLISLHMGEVMASSVKHEQEPWVLCSLLMPDGMISWYWNSLLWVSRSCTLTI